MRDGIGTRGLHRCYRFQVRGAVSGHLRNAVKPSGAGIEDLFTLQIPEGQRLEFKRKSDPDRADLNADDKKSLGESLSAFSNAEGGVILFGIEDKRGTDGLDYAKNAQP
jgi:hypothetical protein